ncbi:hypothetical protein [Massilia genomosp. 1]|uniref:Uncharacterized protein n=1 Tax=Massilia genomosp. 1 TaxID=2609280 RepID=A0ABX0N4Y0_9BURK|nr:hypothetical protein [Massilia genomosp. 1]NHZ67100.1 hypothetical protein [Massilia genomosp. 1]
MTPLLAEFISPAACWLRRSPDDRGARYGRRQRPSQHREPGHRLRQCRADANVKLKNFPYTKYGTVDAKVEVLTADAVTDEKMGVLSNHAEIQISYVDG